MSSPSAILQQRCRLGIYSLLLHVVVLLLVLWPTTIAAQQLLLGAPLNPFGSGFVQQMAFDPTNQTLYLANRAGHTIVQVLMVSEAPLVPSNAAPWSYAVLAGSGAAAPPGPVEVRPTVATFKEPTGVVGWPQYAVSPFTSTPSNRSDYSWVGLWVTDTFNHAVRFIDFTRGCNVTLVAGSSIGAAGVQDGIGAAASLNNPEHIAWAWFLRRTVDGVVDSPLVDAAKTSVVYWGEFTNQCIRQGIPIQQQQGSLGLVLNVSSFAGRCGGASGSATGPVYSTNRVFNNIEGIAVVVVPTNPDIPPDRTAVLFVAEFTNHRLSMIAPMYPSSARFLTAIVSSVGSLLGVTIGRVRSGGLSGTGGDFVVVDLIVGTYPSQQFLNISVRLMYEGANNNNYSVALASGTPMVMNVWTGVGINSPFDSSFIRYTPNRSYVGTLVVFSGSNTGNGPARSGYGGPVLQFYCCLGAEFSEFSMPPSDDITTTRSSSGTGTETASSLSSSSSSSSSRPPKAAKHRRSTTDARVSFSKTMTTDFTRTTIRRAVTSRRMWQQLSEKTPTAVTQPAKVIPHKVIPFSESSSTKSMIAASTLSGVITSTVVLSASTKAAITGRTAAVWECSLGPPQGSAADPQQFLSFGVSLGGSSNTEGVTRAALILTSCVRVALFVVLGAVARQVHVV